MKWNTKCSQRDTLNHSTKFKTQSVHRTSPSTTASDLAQGWGRRLLLTQPYHSHGPGCPVGSRQALRDQQLPVGDKMYQKAQTCQGRVLGMTAWLASWPKGRRTLPKQVWEPVQNRGSIASLKGGFAESGVGWGQSGVEGDGMNKESKTDVRLVLWNL